MLASAYQYSRPTFRKKAYKSRSADLLPTRRYEAFLREGFVRVARVTEQASEVVSETILDIV
jgi:hypothetical protein